MKKLFTLVFFLLTGLFSFSSAFAQRIGCPMTGLVPCGTPGCPCTLCDFFVMFDRIIDFLLVPCALNYYLPLVPAIGALMLAIGGFVYIFAHSGVTEGGAEQLNKAKKIFVSVAIGLLIIYSAWLMVNLFFQAMGVSEWTGLEKQWWKIKCDVDVIHKPPPEGDLECFWYNSWSGCSNYVERGKHYCESQVSRPDNWDEFPERMWRCCCTR